MQDQDVVYPIAEMFDSCQGEGLYTGTRMFFIRLAGCTVGRRYPKERYLYTRDVSEQQPAGNVNPLPIYTEKCTLWDGREFPCDTDYRRHLKLDVGRILEVVKSSGAERVCITGGEPFMHNLEPLTRVLRTHTILEGIHIETSGTVPLSRALPSLRSPNYSLMRDMHKETYGDLWVTVSPKKGVLPEMCARANELKILVDEVFHDNPLLPDYIKQHPLVYLQPVNHENVLNAANLEFCIDLQQKLYPQFRISVQMHKIMHVR